MKKKCHDTRERQFCCKGIVGFLVVFLSTLCGAVGTMPVFATASSITLSVVDNIAIDIVPDSDGNFATSDTSASNISVKTDNYTGYTLGIKAGTEGVNALSAVSGATIPSITTAIPQSTYSSDSTYNNTWGYRPSKLNSAANSNYLQAPTSSSTVTVLDATSVANPTTANTYNIAIGARVSNGTAPGAYTNTFVITAIANAIPYTIAYDANGGSGAPAGESSASYSETVPISSTVPTKTNYDFVGWCVGTSSSSNVTTTAGTDSCNSTTYAAGGDWALDQTVSSNALYLYAMWDLKSYTVTVNFAGDGITGVALANSTYGGGGTVSVSGGTVNLKHGVAYDISASLSSNYTLDGWATAGNGTLGSTSANPTTYTVTGVSTLTATGKLWFQNATSANCGATMYDNRGDSTYKNVAYTTAEINNLCWMTRNLDLPGGTTLSHADTNVPENYSTSTTGFTNGDTLPASSASGFSSNTTAYVYNSGSTTCADGSPCYSYYSWRAVTAGYDATNDGDAVGYDICPAGWRLPTQAELTALKNSYTTGATLTASPFLGVYAGSYSSSSFNDGGSYGNYWSSTANASNYAYNVYFDSSSADVGNYGKDYGLSVRCVAKQ